MKVDFVDGRALIRVREGLTATVEITEDRQVRLTQNGIEVDPGVAAVMAGLGSPLEFWQPVTVAQAYVAAMPDSPVEHVRRLAMNPLTRRIDWLFAHPQLETVMMHDPSPKVRVEIAKRTRSLAVAEALAADEHRTVRLIAQTRAHTLRAAAEERDDAAPTGSA